MTAQSFRLDRSLIIFVSVVAILAGAGSAGVFGWWAILIMVGAVAAGVGALAIWRTPLYGVFALAAVLPLERIGAIEYGSVTIRLSQIILLYLLVVTLLQWLAAPRANRPAGFFHNPIFVPLLLFLATAWVSLLWTPHLTRSLTVLGYITFTTTVALLVPYYLTDWKKIIALLRVLLISAFVVSVFGLYQFTGDIAGLPQAFTGLRDLYTKDILGLPRVQSTAYEPLYFGNYLLLPLMLGCALFFTWGKNSLASARQISIFLLVTGLAFILTLARGAFLAAAIGLIVVLLFNAKTIFRPERLMIFLAAAGLLGGAAWYVLVNTGGPLVNNWDTFTKHVLNVFSGASFEERSYTLEQGLRLFGEKPLFGHGIGAFGPALSPYTFVEPKQGWAIVNNEYVEILAEQGILGLAGFVGIILAICVSWLAAFRRTKDAQQRAILIALIAALAALLTQYLTYSTLYVMHMWAYIGVMVAVGIRGRIANKK